MTRVSLFLRALLLAVLMLFAVKPSVALAQLPCDPFYCGLWCISVCGGSCCCFYEPVEGDGCRCTVVPNCS
jgi:hypothetical protein